jgi:hypothetical protein
VIYVPAVNVFLVQGDPPLALSGISSHIRHPIAYCRENSSFMEIHGSIWDRFGHYWGGPASRGMDRVASRVVDGVVEIKVTEITEGPPRGTGSPDLPAGQFCEYADPTDARNGFLQPPPPPPMGV